VDDSLGRWPDASQAYLKALALEPTDHATYFHAAPVLLLAGDQAAYRRVCREMLARFGGTDHVAIAERVVKTCLLRRDGVDDRDAVWRLADRVLAAPSGDGNPWGVLALGMANYRQGRLPEAVARLQGIATAEPPIPLAQAMAYVFLALAHHDLSQRDEARRALGRAAAVQERQFPKLEGLTDDWSRGEWLRLQVVRREAETLLGGGPRTPTAP
jgi:tetratricopeptide (TPR) repeat protein